MARFKKQQATVTAVVTDVEPEVSAKLVRPGFKSVVRHGTHDGIVKAKSVEKGMRIRSWLHDKPCGSEKVVESVERVGDGSKVLITFSSAHPATEYKAAYRFYVAALVGTPTQKVESIPALVAYEEV
jgi:hypothetical protein